MPKYVLSFHLEFHLFAVFYLCSTETKKKEKGQGAEMRSCMVHERSDELVIRCEKLTSCAPRWI